MEAQLRGRAEREHGSCSHACMHVTLCVCMSSMRDSVCVQAGEHTVPVRMPVKLKYAMARNWVAVVVLQLAAAHDVVSCGFPVAAGGASPWQHVRSAPSSRAEVSEPLLLPLSAVSDSGPDVAEVAVCAVNGPDSTAALRGPPMQVRSCGLLRSSHLQDTAGFVHRASRLDGM